MNLQYIRSAPFLVRSFISLQVPWYKEKGDSEFQTTYIGFLWNLVLEQVSLPEEKRVKFRRRRVQIFLDLFTDHPHGYRLSSYTASFKGNEFL
jgi:hypothetical protein